MFFPVFLGRARVQRSVRSRAQPVSLVKVNGGEACPGCQTDSINGAWERSGTFAWHAGL